MPTIQGLEFIIDSDIDNAVKKIDSLGNSLTGLKNSSKGGIGLRTAATQLKNFDDVLRGIDLTRFDQFSNALSRIGTANPKISKSFIDNLAGLQTVISSITDADIDRIDRLATALGKMPSQLNLRGLGSVGKSAQGGIAEVTQTAENGAEPAATNGIDSLTDSVERFERASAPASETFSRLVGLFRSIGGGLASKVSGFFKGLIGKVASFFNSIKRIAFYRLIRSVMRMITQGFTEGLKNMYAYSQAVGTQFAGSMDRLATSALYLKNSLASVAAPLINALAPAIDFVADKLAALFNMLAQFIARLSGKTTYTAAKKVATTWQDAAENATGGARKAVDEFRRYVLGFDELNILGSERNSGGGGGGGGAGGLSGADMFEERTIDAGISSFADQIRKAFENKDWKSLGVTLGTAVNNVIDNIPWDKAGTKVGEAVNALFTTAYWTLDTINFTNIGSGVAEFLNNALAATDFTMVGGTIAAAIGAALDTVGGFLEGLNWEQIGTKISELLTGVFDEGSSWLDEHDWESFGEGMVSSARDFFEGAEGESIAESLSTFIGKAIRAGGKTLYGVGQGIVNGIMAEVQYQVEELGRNPKDMQSSAIRNSFWTMLTNILNPGMGALQELHMVLMPEELFSENHQSWQEWGREHVLDPLIQGITGNGDFDFVTWFERGIDNLKKKVTLAVAGLLDALKRQLEESSIYQRLSDLFGWGDIDYLHTGSSLTPKSGVAKGRPEIVADVRLQRDGWTTLDNFVGGLRQKPVTLGKDGWTTLDSYVGDISTRRFQLGKSDWTTIDKYVGDISTRKFQLGKNSWTTLDSYVGNISTRKFGLGKNNWTSLDSYVGTISTRKFGLGKNGWTSLDAYVGTIPAKSVSLTKNGWTTLDGYVGALSAQPLTLYKNGWNSVYDFTGTKVDVGVQLYKSGWTDFKSFIGLANGGIVTKNGAVRMFRSGGWVQGAKSGAFPAYAGGAVNAGSVFVAGEAGPELVAHVNNRSEVLNASQIAQTMYHSTIAGMRAIAGDIAAAVGSQINTDNSNQPIVCEVYLDRDRIATAVTRGQQAQNRRYSSTAKA